MHYREAKSVVQMTLTTADEDLCRILEPNVCTTKRRFEVLKILRDNEIPTVVWLSPLLPFINDTEENLLGVLNYCAEARTYGVICFGIGVTLREGDREYYYKCLDRHFPGRKERYIRKYGNAYEVISERSDALLPVFHDFCAGHGIVHDNTEIFGYLRTFEEKTRQLTLF
jgi:DNA repair photolyase